MIQTPVKVKEYGEFYSFGNIVQISILTTTQKVQNFS